MKIEKLFHVLVVAGAALGTGLVGCSSDDDSGSSSGDATGGDASGDACEAVCGPSESTDLWTDCNGCCCWLPVGTEATIGTPTCGEEPCCVGRGR